MLDAVERFREILSQSEGENDIVSYLQNLHVSEQCECLQWLRQNSYQNLDSILDILITQHISSNTYDLCIACDIVKENVITEALSYYKGYQQIIIEMALENNATKIIDYLISNYSQILRSIKDKNIFLSIASILTSTRAARNMLAISLDGASPRASLLRSYIYPILGYEFDSTCLSNITYTETCIRIGRHDLIEKSFTKYELKRIKSLTNLDIY